MENNLYMRVRGRVLGPYNEEKLQGLARRGQLSRMHEVSQDGVSWVRASTYPELFTNNDFPDVSAEASGRSKMVVEGFDGRRVGDAYPAAGPKTAAPAAAAGSAQGKWYYTSAGEQRGPVDFTNLQILAGLGQLGLYDQVWTEGMAAWAPAAQIQGLIKQSAAQNAADSLELVELPENVVRATTDSRGWAIFIACSIYLFAVLNVLAGILVIISGAREQVATLVEGGICTLAHAAVIFIGAILLTSYALRLGKIRHAHDVEAVERALDALRNFWIFVSMYLVVVMVLVMMASIAVFANVVTLPHISF